MSKHDSTDPADLVRRTKRPDDKGELAFEVSALDNGMVVLDWGRYVSWIGLAPDEARELAQKLERMASIAEKKAPPS